MEKATPSGIESLTEKSNACKGAWSSCMRAEDVGATMCFKQPKASGKPNWRRDALSIAQEAKRRQGEKTWNAARLQLVDTWRRATAVGETVNMCVIGIEAIRRRATVKRHHETKGL